MMNHNFNQGLPPYCQTSVPYGTPQGQGMQYWGYPGMQQPPLAGMGGGFQGQQYYPQAAASGSSTRQGYADAAAALTSDSGKRRASVRGDEVAPLSASDGGDDTEPRSSAEVSRVYRNKLKEEMRQNREKIAQLELELEETKRQLNIQKQTIQGGDDLMKNMQADYGRITTDQQFQIQTLQSENKKSKSDLAHSTSRVNLLEELLKANAREITSMNETNANQKKVLLQLIETKRTLLAKQQELEPENQALKGKLAAIEAENQASKEKLAAIEAENQELKKQMASSSVLSMSGELHVTQEVRDKAEKFDQIAAIMNGGDAFPNLLGGL